MPDTTPRLGLDRPLADRSDPPDILVVRDLATDMDNMVVLNEGTVASRPAPGIPGRIYRVTDVPGRWDFDTGSGWDTFRRSPNVVTDANFPAAGTAADGEEIIYRPPTLNHNGEFPEWRLRYEASTGRWRFKGGSPLFITASGSAYSNLGAGWQFAEAGFAYWIPTRSGDYRIDVGFMALQNNVNGLTKMDFGAALRNFSGGIIAGQHHGSITLPINLSARGNGIRRLFIGPTQINNSWLFVLFTAPGWLLNGNVQNAEMWITPEWLI